MQNDLAAAMSRIQQLEKGYTKLASRNDAGESDNADITQRMSELVQRHAQEQQAMENTIQSLHSQVKDLQKQVLLLSEQKHTEPVLYTQNKVSCAVTFGPSAVRFIHLNVENFFMILPRLVTVVDLLQISYI
jgi:predicted nuclease with TOPRIM domain